jgi:hypothetical protein
MIYKLLPLHILLFFFLSTCKYAPLETNDQSVDMPQPNIDFNIIVLDTNSSNIFRGDVKIAIQTLLHGHTVIAIQGYLNDRNLTLDTTHPGYISFRSNYYTDGNYTFRLILYTTTNSGSLADRIGEEYIYAIKEYPVIVFNAPIQTPSITGFSVVDGALSINWSKYSQPGFKKYVLMKNEVIIATITTSSQTNYQDTTYIGEYATYKLITSVLSYTLTGDNNSCILPPTEFTAATQTKDGKTQLTWKPCSFIHAFGKYVLAGLADTAEFSSLSDTTCFDDLPPIGLPGGTYKMHVVAKNGTRSNNDVTIQGPQIGKHLGPDQVRFFQYVPSKNIYYGCSAGSSLSLYRYGGDSLDYLASRNLDFPNSRDDTRDIHPSGTSLYVYDESTYGTIKTINCETFITEESYNYSNLIMHSQWRPLALRVSKDNKLIVIYQDDHTNMHIYVFNINTKEVLASLALGYYRSSSLWQISSDGKYILYGAELFCYQGNIITKIGTGVYGTISRDDSTIITSTDHSIQFLRCADLQVYKEILVHKNIYPNYQIYDKCKDVLAVGSPQGYSIYDANTGAKRGMVRSVEGIWALENGVMFTPLGYYQRLKLE